jgi:hypothetical protein
VKPFVLVALVLVVVVAGCGGTTSAAPAYTLAPTKQCVRSTLGIHVFPSIADDFVASTASGGALRMQLGDLNEVTLLFGKDSNEASNLADAYRRFHAKNVGIEDILRTNNNVVLLWKFHPSAGDEQNVNGCLK